MDAAHGNLLELLSTAHNRFATVQATCRYWCHTAQNADANEQERCRNRYAAEPTPLVRAGVEQGGDGPPCLPSEQEFHYRLWLEQSSRWRYEVDWPTGNGPATRLSIFNGSLWWINDPLIFGKQTNAEVDTELAASLGPPRPGLPPTARYGSPYYLGDPERQSWLDPSAELDAFSMELLGQTNHAGREALRVRALVRDEIEDLEPSPGLWLGADEIELLVDLERGVLLRAIGYIAGRPFALTEVRQVAFDLDLPSDLFSIPPII